MAHDSNRRRARAGRGAPRAVAGPLASRRRPCLGRDAGRRRRAERHYRRKGGDRIRLRAPAASLRPRSRPLPGSGDDRPTRTRDRDGPRRADPGALRRGLGRRRGDRHGRHQLRGLRCRVRRHRPRRRDHRHPRSARDRRRARHPRLDGADPQLHLVRANGSRAIAGALQFRRAGIRGSSRPGPGRERPQSAVRPSAGVFLPGSGDGRRLDHALDDLLPAVGERRQEAHPRRSPQFPRRDAAGCLRESGSDGRDRHRRGRRDGGSRLDAGSPGEPGRHARGSGPARERWGGLADSHRIDGFRVARACCRVLVRSLGNRRIARLASQPEPQAE